MRKERFNGAVENSWVKGLLFKYWTLTHVTLHRIYYSKCRIN